MDERLKFVARLLEGEKMAPLCREFGISRVTGHKIFNRYKECGLHGLNDRSRRPYRQSNKLPFQIERTILGIKKEHPSWGAPKIRDKLLRDYRMIKPPAISTVHAVLDRNGLSRLSVWWLRLGINIERIKPGNPQQNGRHERMHLTLKKEATKPPPSTSCNSSNASISSSRFTITSVRTRPSAAPTPAICIHLQPASTCRPVNPITRFTIELSASPAAGVSASVDAKSISVMCLPAKPSAFERSMTGSGWSASCNMT
jgi:hypothetical protein